jgi:hypothetical protein
VPWNFYRHGCIQNTYTGDVGDASGRICSYSYGERVVTDTRGTSRDTRITRATRLREVGHAGGSAPAFSPACTITPSRHRVRVVLPHPSIRRLPLRRGRTFAEPAAPLTLW